MKVVLLRMLLMLILATGLFAAPLIPIPVDCFENDVTCSHSDVIKKEISGKIEEVTHIEIFTYLAKEDFDNEQEIADIFFNFSNWKTAVTRMGSDTIRIKKSLSLPPIMDNGVLIRRQYLNYKVLGPPPIFYVKARAVGHYWLTDPVPGAILSGKFKHLNTGTFLIEDEKPLEGSEGYKYHVGEFHISEDDEAFYLHFVAEMIPDIDFLPATVAHHVEKGYLSIIEALYF